jgi:hypothetical protein
MSYTTIEEAKAQAEERARSHNPAAFPNEGFNGWGKPQDGMTLRDYFAARVMQGLLSGLEAGNEHQVVLIPKTAYDMADLMLKAREQ